MEEEILTGTLEIADQQRGYERKDDEPTSKAVAAITWARHNTGDVTRGRNTERGKITTVRKHRVPHGPAPHLPTLQQ